MEQDNLPNDCQSQSGRTLAVALTRGDVSLPDGIQLLCGDAPAEVRDAQHRPTILVAQR